MSRKILTQIFPFLLPLRKWQRKKFFYFKMQLDGYRYAQKKSVKILPNINQCQIGYQLPDNIKIEEGGV